MTNHAYQIDVWEGHDVQHHWIIAPGDIGAIMVLKKMPGPSAKASLKLKGQIPDRVATEEIGLDLTAAGAFGRLDDHSN